MKSLLKLIARLISFVGIGAVGAFWFVNAIGPESDDLGRVVYGLMAAIAFVVSASYLPE